MFSGHPPSVKRWTTFTAFSSRTQKGAKIQIRVWAIGNQKKLKTCTTNQGDLCSIYACVLIAFCNILFVSAFHLNITFKFFSVFLPSEFFATYTLKNTLQFMISVAYVVWILIRSNGDIFHCENGQCDLVVYRSCKLGNVSCCCWNIWLAQIRRLKQCDQMFE